MHRILASLMPKYYYYHISSIDSFSIHDSTTVPKNVPTALNDSGDFLKNNDGEVLEITLALIQTTKFQYEWWTGKAIGKSHVMLQDQTIDCRGSPNVSSIIHLFCC